MSTAAMDRRAPRARSCARSSPRASSLKRRDDGDGHGLRRRDRGHGGPDRARGRPLDPAATSVKIAVRGPGVIARSERPALRFWSRPPEGVESPIRLAVTWPEDARAGFTGVVRVDVRHSLGRAAVLDVRLPLPPSVSLAAPVAGVQQIQGVLARRRSVDQSALPTVIEIPVRFGLGLSATVPEAHATVALEDVPRAVAPRGRSSCAEPAAPRAWYTGRPRCADSSLLSASCSPSPWSSWASSTSSGPRASCASSRPSCRRPRARAHQRRGRDPRRPRPARAAHAAARSVGPDRALHRGVPRQREHGPSPDPARRSAGVAGISLGGASRFEALFIAWAYWMSRPDEPERAA